MPFVRSSVSKRCTRVIAMIFSLSKIMPTYSRCVLKGLVCIIIIALLGYQPSSYAKYTKLNMRLSCDIKSVSNAKYICLIRFYILRSLQFFYLIYFRVSCNGYCGET